MSAPPPPPAPMLVLDGFEGPLDLLLDLARAQKVDLASISILTLVDQYLAAVAGSLELAADWLVMAAWLAWLKSRLLLPADPEAAEDGVLAAGALQRRLADLAGIGEAVRWLDARPLLGRDVFGRGAAESLRRIDRSGLVLEIGALLGAYMRCCRRAAGRAVYRPRPPAFWTARDATERLRRLLGAAPPGWTALERFLPDAPAALERDTAEAGASALRRRAALAGTLLAGLELAKNGAAELRQDRAFGPVLIRPLPAADAA